MLFEAFTWASFGLILGSFANVVILRYASGRTTGGRSACPHCERTLRWFELIPVFSWIFLQGTCRTCRAGISIQYPLVEILTGVLVLFVGLAPVSLPLRILGIGIALLLVAMLVYDLKHTIIPDRWSFSFAALAFVSGVLTNPPTDFFALALFILAGPLVALPLAMLWLISRGEWMGLGDAKLTLGTGWLLGMLAGYLSLMVAFVVGAAVGLFLLFSLPYLSRMLVRTGITSLRGEKPGFTMKSEVPFGPFLILGVCIFWFSALYNLDTVGWMLDFLSWS